MLHVIINGQTYYIESNDQIRAAQEALQGTDLSETPILDTDDEGDSIDTGDTLPDEFEEKAWALAEALGCSILSNIGYDGRGYGPDVWTSDDEPGEYYVLDESEREETAMACLDSYLEDCVLSEIPERYRSYFNEERWKQDVLDNDGYGHTISSYDGHEREVCIDGTYYYVYRVN